MAGDGHSQAPLTSRHASSMREMIIASSWPRRVLPGHGRAGQGGYADSSPDDASRQFGERASRSRPHVRAPAASRSTAQIWIAPGMRRVTLDPREMGTVSVDISSADFSNAPFVPVTVKQRVDSSIENKGTNKGETDMSILLITLYKGLISGS